jgi:uncharacterized protein
MPVSPEEVVERLRAQERVQRGEAEARAAAHRSKLGEASAILRQAGAARVWLFGSLSGGTGTSASDVDLAAEGLPKDRYFEALAALMALFGSRVDLVSFESAPESLRRAILETGREL